MYTSSKNSDSNPLLSNTQRSDFSNPPFLHPIFTTHSILKYPIPYFSYLTPHTPTAQPPPTPTKTLTTKERKKRKKKKKKEKKPPPPFSPPLHTPHNPSPHTTSPPTKEIYNNQDLLAIFQFRGEKKKISLVVGLGWVDGWVV
jgi:hypothetical protein